MSDKQTWPEVTWRIHKSIAYTRQNVEVVEMPCCGFSFDAEHLESNESEYYTCPQCEPENRELGAIRRLCETHPDVDYTTQWGCPDCLAELRTENRELVASVVVLSEALKQYGSHDDLDGCGAIEDISPHCRCGLSEVLADLPAAAKAYQDRLAQAEAKVERLVEESERLNRMINQQGHIVEFRETSFGLEHPMECRSTLDGKPKSLIDCLVNRALESLAEPPKVGRYRVELKHYGIKLAEIGGSNE